MGVHGLWQLLSSTGKPVSLDSLEGKVLAVDVSVWLHQLSKGMRDSDGNPLPHAHLHGLFTRICKLLYYRIKPVFVFDGGVPVLKKQTLAGRREKREDAEQESTRLQKKLLTNLIRSQAVKEALGLDKAPKLPTVPKKPTRDAIFELPPLPESSERYLVANKELDESFEERRELQQLVEDEYEDLNAIDVDSEDFRSLPSDIQHEIIMDMKERRKNYKMSRKTELPEDSKDFSKFQVSKLLKHSKLTVRLDDLRKELNSKTTEISKHLGDSLYGKHVTSQRVVSEDASHSVLIKGLRDKKELESDMKKTKVISKDFPTVSEESSNSDELMQDSGSEERANMDFLQPDQLAVIGKAITSKAGLGDMGIGEEDGSSLSVDTYRSNSRIADSNVNAKPTFRPVIEIETDSESSDEDYDCRDESFYNDLISEKGVNNTNIDLKNLIPKTVNESSDNDVIVIDDLDLMEDVQANRDLQLAIEKSIQDQINLVASGPTKGEAQKSSQPQKNSAEYKSIFSKQISNQSGFSDGESKSDGQDVIETEKELDVNRRIKEKSKSIFQKQISNISNFSDESDLSDKMIDYKTKQNVASLKRSIAESSEGKPEAKKTKLDISSEMPDTNGKAETFTSLSSDSENDFVEVKFDPSNVKEDDLFPASMFEPILETDEVNGDAEEIKDSKSVNSLAVKAIDVKAIDRNESSDVDMIEESSRVSNKEPTTLPHDKDVSEDIVGKDDSTEMVSQVDEKKLTDVVNHMEKASEEAVNEAESGDKPDIIDTRRSGSSVSSVPDIIESADESVSHSQEVFVSPESMVPDLVKDYQSLDFQTLTGMRENLAAESQALQQERGRQERLATSINDQMHAEAQELLRLFGVPYIVSPTEAEAQCAQLDILNLTQGTITDDSDVWLFGGINVYRNFFNQQKHVEFYREENIRTKLGLTREKLINLALLCGSDYTEGIQGVGPITAMEILMEFPGEGLEGLLTLKSWWEAAQKQYVKPKESKLKAKIRELDIHPGFPSRQVVEAYMSPTVDDSAEPFSWGGPDVEGLRHYIGIKLGWSAEKVDEHLQPVLKRLQDKQSQRRISSFFQPETYIEPAKMKSKRLQKVVNKFLNLNEASKSDEDKTSGKGSRSREASPLKGKKKGRAKNKVQEEASETDSNEIEEGMEDANKKAADNESTRGRGRGRGRAQNQRGKGQRGRISSSVEKLKADEKTKLTAESSGTCDSESDSDFDLESINSEYEVPVVESGLNIAEILGMSGFVCAEPSTEAGKKVAFEKGGSDSENSPFASEFVSDSMLGDESISDSEWFKNEGGFIREDDDGKEVKPVKPQRSEIMHNVLKQLEAAKSKYFETEASQDENFTGGNGDLPVDGHAEMHKSDALGANSGRTELGSVDSDDLTKAEAEDVSEEAKKPVASVPQKKIDYSKKIESILNEDRKKGRKDNSKWGEFAESDDLKHEGNDISKLDKPFDKDLKVKIEKDESSVAEYDKAADVQHEVDEIDMKEIKDNKMGQIKTELLDSSTNDPAKTLVTGVPWASKKGKTKAGKGKARLKGRKMEPVEKIVRKSTRSVKGIKNAVGVVNLSESDTDSSD